MKTPGMLILSFFRHLILDGAFLVFSTGAIFLASWVIFLRFLGFSVRESLNALWQAWPFGITHYWGLLGDLLVWISILHMALIYLVVWQLSRRSVDAIHRRGARFHDQRA